MNEPSPVSASVIQISRFVACDISKRSVMVAAIDHKQQILIQPKKIRVEKFSDWAAKNLKISDRVVLEATGDAWYYYDLLQSLVASVTVANPHKVRLIAQTKVKTDARDALALARLLAADLIPAVWVPPLEIRELRALVAHRQRLVRQRTQARNRLHAILQTHHVAPVAGDLFSLEHRQWWGELPLSTTTKLLIEQFLTILHNLIPLIARIEAELIQLSTSPRWYTPAAFLIQLPGIGVMTAMTILSAIGDITRFENAKRLVGYSGLGAGVYASGEVVRGGRITKEGRQELRTALVEAAWTAVEQPGHWQKEFERLCLRLDKSKAIVAVARKLLVVIWHVLSKEEAEKSAQAERVAKKLMTWSLKLRAKGRAGLSCKEFVRRELGRLRIGQDLKEFSYAGKPVSLIPLEKTG